MTAPGAVVFDLFGVIACHQDAAGRDALLAIAGEGEGLWDAYWRLRPLYDRGVVTATAYWSQVAEALGTRFDEPRIRALVAADVASWSAVDPVMVALVERAAASGTRLGLLSNIPEDLAAHYERHHARWLRCFEVVAFSCRVGHAKPALDAYRWCCRALDLEPARILFIDDRAENLEAAAHLGIATHLFVDAAQVAELIGPRGG
jgi:putative hydrolase of the HAD superfamily